MKRWYITFSGQAWNDTTRKIVENAPKLGADEVLVYDDRWLMTQEFYQLNHWLWDHHGDAHNVKRGFGWFCWKPFILMHCLDHFMAEGDVVLFTDADTYPVADLDRLYRFTAGHPFGGMFFAAQGCSNRQWVKRDCWLVMGLADCQAWMPPPVPLDSQHATARFILIRKGSWRPRQLLTEWLTYCINPHATTFEPSRILAGGEYEGFAEHRTEQAILSLLTHKYGYPLHREACQFGNAALAQFGEDSWYPQTFIQEWGGGPREVGAGSAYRNVEAMLAR